jgi:transcriptional regulator with XRE-family HTH domain
MENYGVILRKLREINQLKMKEAAIKVGRSAGWLSEVENGRGAARLLPSEFERIVRVYGGEAYKKQFGLWIAKAKTPPAPPKDAVLSGAILKHLRKKAKLTLLEAAQRIGVSRAYLSAIETGRRPVPQKARNQLMAVYGYSPSSFKNFATEDKRAKNIPTRYKLDLLLFQMDEGRIERLFLAAKDILSTPTHEIK